MSSRRPLTTRVKANLEVVGFSPAGAQKEWRVGALDAQAPIFCAAAQHSVSEQALGWASRAPPEGFLCDLELITRCAVSRRPSLCPVGAD